MSENASNRRSLWVALLPPRMGASIEKLTLNERKAFRWVWHILVYSSAAITWINTLLHFLGKAS